jgi:hypothetical protein
MEGYDDVTEMAPEQVITDIHQGQVDLSILAEWLARNSKPDIPNIILYALAVLHTRINQLSPSLARH